MCNFLPMALVICLGSLCSASASLDETPMPMPESVAGELSPTQYEDIRAFLELVRHPGIHGIRARESSSANEKAFSLNSQAGGDYVSLDYDVRSSLVVGYTRENPRVHEPDKKWDLVVRKKEDAFRIAGEVLAFYGLPGEMSAYEISEQVDSSGLIEDHDWSVHKDFALEGVPCRKRFFRCCVCAYTGIIWGVTFKPPIPPAECTESIDKNAARSATEECLRSDEYIRRYTQRYEILPCEEFRKVIALPDEYSYCYDEGEGAPDTGCAYYCWEVPVAAAGLMGEKVSFFVWVRMDTGKVIGWDMKSGHP